MKKIPFLILSCSTLLFSFSSTTHAMDVQKRMTSSSELSSSGSGQSASPSLFWGLFGYGPESGGTNSTTNSPIISMDKLSMSIYDQYPELLQKKSDESMHALICVAQPSLPLLLLQFQLPLLIL